MSGTTGRKSDFSHHFHINYLPLSLPSARNLNLPNVLFLPQGAIDLLWYPYRTRSEYLSTFLILLALMYLLKDNLIIELDPEYPVVRDIRILKIPLKNKK